MTRMRRLLAVVLLAGLWLLVSGPAAGAHALVRSSDPASGATLARAPDTVTVVFTEPPDPRLSTMRVLDTSGRPVDQDKAGVVPGNPIALRVPLGALRDGTYTVSWRVLSRVDGHVTAGSFAFSVGAAAPGTVPAAPAAPVVQTPPPAPLAVAGRWALYWGLALLVGAAVTGLLVTDRLFEPRGAAAVGAGPLLVGALVLAVAGLMAIGVAERASAGVPLGRLLASGTGQGLARQAVALAVTAAATGALLARPQSTWRLWLVGVAAAGAMLAHAAAGHAATPSPLRGLNLLVQWAHLVAVGVWIGGLVWLLVGIRRRGRPEQVAAAVRFSRIAGIALGVVALTGLGRALDEVGGWGRLLGTGFGKTLVVKTALVGVLVSLGALNRYRIVPALHAGTGQFGALRTSVRGELLVAASVLVAAAVLSELPPGASLPAAATPATPAMVEASGADYATSVRLTLTITPGIAGPNRFQATFVDYDTGRPVSAQRVTLRFALPARPDIGASTLELRPAGKGQGRWQGQGSILSVQGRWQVTALVQAPAGTAGAVTVPLEILTRTPPELLQPPRLTGPPPPDPPGAVVLGGQAGSVLIGLTAYPVGATLVVRVRGGLGIPPPVVPTLRILAPDGHALGTPLRRCGDGCLEALVTSPRPGRYTVLAQVPKGTARFTLPMPLPPPAPARLRVVDRTLAASRSYRIHEVLTGGLGTVFRTDYLLKAPDSMQQHTKGSDGSTADVIWIGEERWLRQGTGPWKHEKTPGLTVRFPARNWSDQERNVVDLGPSTFHGTRVDVLAFLDPAAGAYHRLWVDQRNRVLHERMDAPGHFMDRDYTAYGAPLTISPPR